MRLPVLEGNVKEIDYDQFKKMVDIFMEHGFTYFDTAYMYHNYESEIAVRECLVKRYPRNQFTIATKMPLMFLETKEELDKYFNEQLEKVGVDYFDYYLLHNINVHNYATAQKTDAFNYIFKKKAEGKIKYAGFSFHDRAELLDKVLSAHPDVDFVQLQINYLDWENESIQSRKCYEVAQKHNKRVIVMEPVKGGTLAAIPLEAKKEFEAFNNKLSIASWAIRYAASFDLVDVVLSGMSNLAQLNDNISYMDKFIPLGDKEQDLVGKVVQVINRSIVVPCTACGYCVEGCPKAIPIPEFFALYNTEKQSIKQMFSIQSVYYANYAKNHGKASVCIECGKCEESCPQHIEIIKHLKDVAKTFEGS